MKTQQAIDYFGGRKALADAIGCDRSAIAHWGDDVPGLRPYQIQVLSGGRLKAPGTACRTRKKAAMGSNTELIIHLHLAGHTAKAVSEAIGGDETLISRFKSGERGLCIEQIGPFLAEVGLKLVTNDEVTVDPKCLESLSNLAARGI